MGGDDFVNVRLTRFGEEQAAGAPIQVHNGNHSFYFKPGEEQRVTRAFDWERVLRTQHINGHPLFEIVPSVHAEEVATELREKLGVDTSVNGGIPTVEVPQG